MTHDTRLFPPSTKSITYDVSFDVSLTPFVTSAEVTHSSISKPHKLNYGYL